MNMSAVRYASKTVPQLSLSTLKDLLKAGEKGELMEQQFEVPPSTAQKILDGLNSSNRSINETHTRSLVRDINNDNWVAANGSMVSFDRNGKLLDGQHRLSAIVQSNQPLRLSIKFGMPENAKKVIDTGRKRTQQDYIRMTEGADAKYKAERASVARLIYGFIHDQERPASYCNNNKPTQSDLSAILEEYPDIMECVSSVYATGHVGKIVIQSYPAFVAFLANRTPNADKVPQFLDLLTSGANMPATHPIHVVRNRLLTREEFRYQRNKERTIGLLIRAWNMFVKGEMTSNKMHTPDALIPMDGLTHIGNHPLYNNI